MRGHCLPASFQALTKTSLRAAVIHRGVLAGVPACRTSIERLTETDRRHNQVRDHSLTMPLKVSGNNMGCISVKRFANELNSYFMNMRVDIRKTKADKSAS